LGLEPGGGYNTEVCDAWPVRRQTYGYLPSRRASPPPLDRYQIILLGEGKGGRTGEKGKERERKAVRDLLLRRGNGGRKGEGRVIPPNLKSKLRP